MEILLRAFTSIGVLLMLIAGVMLLKRIGTLRKEHGQMCSALIVNVTLPALIFVTLLHTDFDWGYAGMSFVLLGTNVACLGLGWSIARAFRLDGPRTGPVILATGFSSSSVLGVALIGELFPASRELVVEAVIIGSLGMAPLVITVGTMIALYYGARELTKKER
ncbi:MAG: AEC family transporter [Fuerstiella sp.]|nr:AEC family transporter [Fuerstiella sp.]